MTGGDNSKIKPKRRESILWIEGFGFSFIISCIWVTELLRIQHYLFAESEAINWARASFRTAVVVGVWVAVHIATRRLLQRLHHLEEYLRICAWCRKIGHDGEWKTMEQYFGSAFATKTTHAMCPECNQTLDTSAGPKATRVH